MSIEIPQELTLERVAFDAKLVITNGIPDQALDNIRVDVFIRDAAGNPKESLFYIRKPELSGISGVDGTGTVGGGSRGEAHWLIIPSAGAGIVEENSTLKQAGVDYWVGATLSYTIAGKEETVPINPDKITVRPMPQLVLDYFMPFSVLGDNPFTPQVEPPVPYPLALRVLNDGYGQANKLRIDSAQPKIVDNQQGLLVSFKLLGASVNDGAVSPSLTVDFGDLASKKAATAAWQMISTLSGRFIEFKTSFTHASELGGDLTSLIKATNAHYLTHMMKVNLPGRDNRLDFLADTDRDTEHLPDAILESEIPGGTGKYEDARSPVSVVIPGSQPPRPTPENPSVALSLPIGAAGWIYTKLPDPSQGMLKLLDVVRSDGVRLDPNNFWIDEGLDKDYKKTWTLQLVDYRASSSTPGIYTLSFTKPDVDTTPPVTTLSFDGPVTGTGPYHVTPLTKLILTSQDNDGGSGVDSVFRKIEGSDADFAPAYPAAITEPGTYTVRFYSADRAGNVEEAKSATVVVDSQAPQISSFTVTPASFAPQAPKGVAAARSVQFTVNATDTADQLPVQIDIASGGSFDPAKIVRTLKTTAVPGAPLTVSWDGTDSAGKLVATGTYTARVRVSDGLDNTLDPAASSHTSTTDAAVTVAEWFIAAPVDPNTAADQMYPRMDGNRVVWQDNRGGNWDIRTKDLASGEIKALTTSSDDQERPAVSGNVAVWQDRRNGNWDIYGYNLSTATEFAVEQGAGDQVRPVISGDWVAWQDDGTGNWDIYARNISTGETVRVTSHERDQIHPSITGNIISWEDYRHGLGEIYKFDFVTRSETRVTNDSENQTLPAASVANLLWVDERNGQKDIFSADAARGAARVTYGSGDHTQPALSAGLLVFTDFESGLDDPNLSFRFLSGGAGGSLVSNQARQEEPAVGSGRVAWQDARDGKWQIYAGALTAEPFPVEVELKPGFNLVAVGQSLASQYSTASALISAKGTELGIERLLVLDPLHNTYTEATASAGDFLLSKGTGLVIYAGKCGLLQVAGSGEEGEYTLIPGTNQIGMLSIPFGYGAYDLIRSIGISNVSSVRKFDSSTGLWQTAAIRTTAAGPEVVGLDFRILPGDGLQVTVKERVDGWRP